VISLDHGSACIGVFELGSFDSIGELGDEEEIPQQPAQ
jgi:hypothetical protein